MDNTIRMILDADASAQQRLDDATVECAKIIEDAKQKAAALNEARQHATSDKIFELEEAQRASSEAEINAMQADYEQKSAALEQQFTGGQDKLIDTLFREILAGAEA